MILAEEVPGRPIELLLPDLHYEVRVTVRVRVRVKVRVRVSVIGLGLND